jgi:hypothetical protein
LLGHAVSDHLENSPFPAPLTTSPGDWPFGDNLPGTQPISGVLRNRSASMASELRFQGPLDRDAIPDPFARDYSKQLQSAESK